MLTKRQGSLTQSKDVQCTIDTLGMLVYRRRSAIGHMVALLNCPSVGILLLFFWSRKHVLGHTLSGPPEKTVDYDAS